MDTKLHHFFFGGVAEISAVRPLMIGSVGVACMESRKVDLPRKLPDDGVPDRLLVDVVFLLT